MQWVIGVAPYLGDVVYVPLVLFALGLRNQLHVHGPRGELPPLDRLVQILTRVVRVVPCCSLRLIQREILDSLISFKSVLDEEDLALVVDPLESVGTVAVHVSVTLGSAAIRIHYSHCVHRLRNLTEEVPHSIRIKEVFHWVRFESMEKVGCHHGIPKEEAWEVNSDHVVIALFSVEFQSKAADISE